MKNFDGLGLSPVLAENLARMQYTTPTPIQARAIPHALKGRDIMGSAQTGTGKTAAYAIPMIEHIMNNEGSNALILTPTRELGKQVMEVIKQMLGYKSHIKTAFIIGGEPMRKQFQQLDKRPRIIVGTPGRINDHLERGSMDLGLTDFLILDETDRMLDMGFSIQLDSIFEYLPEQRQTLMFSATLPDDIIKMSKQYLDNPERVAVGSTIAPSTNIVQEIIKIDESAKYDELLRQLDERDGTVIMFVKTKFGTERMAKRLKAAGHEAQAIHGDMKQSRRERTIRQLRSKEFRILVATDVVARGLDIPHVKHVVNYDLPQVPEDFIHRVGRTARAGESGEALTFICPKENRKWHAIEILLDPDKKSNSSRSYSSKKGKKRSPNRRERGFAGRPGKNSGRKRSDARNDNRVEGHNDNKRPAKRSSDKRGEEGKSKGRWSDQMTINPNDKRTNRRDKRSDNFGESRYGEKKEGMGKARRKDKSFGKPNGKKPSNKKHSTRSDDNYSEKDFVKPFSKKTSGGKSSAGKPNGKKPNGKKPFGKTGGKASGKSFAGKDGSRPMKRKSSGGRPTGKMGGRPSGNKGKRPNKRAA